MFSSLDRTLIIAEIGNNHEGDMAVARDLVARAAEAGVDAVKFQTFIPEHYCSAQNNERMATLRRFQLSFDQFAELAELARAKGVMFFSTPFDLQSAAFLGTIVDAVKIASGDNTFYPLIRRTAETGKPMIISTGLADRDEIARAVDAAAPAPELALLHCVSSYPVPAEQANLAAIPSLAQAFPRQVIGYSDHTLGNQAAVLAVALGARIIEKHFTLDRNFSAFRDHQLSADPAMLADLVRAVREAESLLGNGAICRMPCEDAAVPAVRRSVAAGRDLAAGATVAAADVTWVRPGGGVAPGDEDIVIGRRLVRALRQGEMIRAEDVE